MILEFVGRVLLNVLKAMVWMALLMLRCVLGLAKLTLLVFGLVARVFLVFARAAVDQDGMVIFVCSGITDNLTVRCGQHLYIASQEAMRKEDFLHCRLFEGSNSPRAGVKVNNDILTA